MNRIGNRLVAEGLIEPAQLARALEEQRREGGYLGHHLMAAGAISAEDFYAALARSWEIATRDLVRNPPRQDLLAEVDVEEMVELGWVACDLIGDTVVIATCVRPAEELVVEVQEHFPGHTAEFVACSQRDLDAVAMGVRRRRSAGHDRPEARPIVRASHHFVALAIGAGFVAAAIAFPLALVGTWLLVAVVSFVVGALVASGAGYPVLVNDVWGEQRAELRLMASMPVDIVNDPIAADQGLPVYTAMVRLRGGDRATQAMLENFSAIDYPWARTDAILLVADSDVETQDALRRATRRAWTRVVRVPDADFDDAVRAYDHGLALARGRYVVAWEQDETPARDQMRRAVAAFERDLHERMDRIDATPPLLALRVAHRVSSTATAFGRLRAADDALRLHHGAGAGEHPDVTSVHCNMRLLRRFGGFATLTRRPTMESPSSDLAPRIEELDSTSMRAVVPGPLQWIRHRAEAFALVLLDAGVQVRLMAQLRRQQRRDPARVRALAIGLGTAAMFLSYPVVLAVAAAVTLRSRDVTGKSAEVIAWLGLVSAAIVLAVATAAAWLVLVRRRGWWSGFAALALPAHWFLHALAAWSALVAVMLQPSVLRAWPRLKP